MPFAAKNILSSLKIRAARNYLGTERTFLPKRDWHNCTLAVSYQEISKRHITSGCSRLKRPSYVFSTTRDCARVKCVLHFFKQFSFHLRTMAESKINLNKSVYPRMKVHKTSAFLKLFHKRIEKPSWLNCNPIALEVGAIRCLSHNLFLVYIVFLRC